MIKRTILICALLPVFAMAQTPKENADSATVDDLSLVGVIDASILDADGEDGSNDASQDINTSVLVSHDVFLNNASYQLSPMRFRVRGYKNTFEETYINGMPFNDQLRGVFNFASIGAMNNITRSGDQTYYSQPGAFTFGTIGGADNILMRAGDYARGGQATVSYTNRTYYLRGMLTLSTGLTQHGWAVTALLGGRYSSEGNVKGTFYRNMSYALLVEKQFRGGLHRVNFVTFGSPVVRGQQNSGSIQEVYDLTGDNLYNANWGYQNGKKRNAKVVKAIDPTAVLSYEGKLNDRLTLNAGASFHFGKYGNSALNWFDGADPRPDYYRYLPSYFYANGNDATAEYYRDLWMSGNTAFTQIDWDSMIRANYQNVKDGNGAAIYMVEERRSDLYETSLNATLKAELNKNNTLTFGLLGRNTVSHQFKKVDDLLGAEYLLDIDKYSDTDFPGDEGARQKDLNRPNRRVYEGGIFDYQFKLHVNSLRGWLNNNWRRGHWEAYYGLQVTYTDFFRDGKMRNGHHPNNSFGVGKRHHFTDTMLKGGLTYKVNGRHMFTVNGAYGTIAPLANDAYISPRYNDETPDGLKSSRLFHIDANYIFSTPKVQGRVSVFNTNFYDLTERTTYYYDGVTMVNQVLTGVRKVHRGVELAASYKVDSHWTINFAGTVAQYYYDNNPEGQFSTDNGQALEDFAVASREKVYMKNVYVGGTPQIAGTLGVRYFIKYWFLGASVNAFGRNFVEASPARRIASRYAGNSEAGTPAVTPYNEYYEAYKQFTHQEMFDGGYTLDVSIGKMFYLSRKQSINVNLSFNNITNKKDIKTGGYEQGRINLEKPGLFGNKYFYMQGFNCFLNVSYKF
ncbi:MAG: TonB-dependent receptor [Alloprevotella sp.]|nr:TonB-dependent receptor [Alloprevotella sp.]